MKTSLAALFAVVALVAPLALRPRSASAADATVVCAAASLKNAFEEIGALVASTNGGARPAFNFGASGDLLAQIRGGAPADVFTAAAAKDMDTLETAGALLAGTRVDFAANEVVLVVPAASTAAVSSFAELAQPGVARVAIVNPKTGPAGRYAEEVFASAGIAGAVRPKLVLAENVRQVLDYAAREEVDAGVVYATDALTRPLAVKVAAVAPAGSHQPVVYQIAVLKRSTDVQAARLFVAAVRSTAGLAILARHGFMPAPSVR